ncbi:hypothetical protein AArcMg_1358 [Natrarchaeobaculum sulfurireducens]|uniref:Pilin/flagellin n=2 Tax=Natrarchaeobaculum sulfurireducens TaxID=2044521 RepID=A0A346PGD1_9EURY|nr:Pilin/flagellin [Natrarchaeobaculum sulfurireducens]AXR81373.1 hypothetical protein AArcMg_1358 [Natrarchaeobaculum sulfurireducens]
MTGSERGQAFTLEGFIGAMVVLMAVLFALQAVVLTPTSGGLADRSIQSQVQQEAQDALVVSDQDGNLSETVRNWDGEGGFNETDGQTGPEGNQTYSAENFGNVSTLGDILNQSFAERGWSYNVELHYTNETGSHETRTLVYQGSPSSDAVTASYTVTLYETQEAGSKQLRNYDEDNDWSIPRSSDSDMLYNVVEVRVTLW